MTIKEFLLARIAEDEAKADEMESTAWYDGGWATEDAVHLRKECAAKRAITTQAGEVNALEAEFTDYMWRGAEPEMNTPKLGDQILSTLAAVYSDHPDYQKEWKP